MLCSSRSTNGLLHVFLRSMSRHFLARRTCTAAVHSQQQVPVSISTVVCTSTYVQVYCFQYACVTAVNTNRIRTSTRCLRLTPPDCRPTTQKWSYFYVPIQIQVISDSLYKNQVISDSLYNFKSFPAHYTKTNSLQTPHTKIKTFQTPMDKNQVISGPPYNFKSFQTPHTIASRFKSTIQKPSHF